MTPRSARCKLMTMSLTVSDLIVETLKSAGIRRCRRCCDHGRARCLCGELRISLAQVKGFALYASRTILSGRGDELIDVAERNVARHHFNGGPAHV
jgi:hypothetical protein